MKKNIKEQATHTPTPWSAFSSANIVDSDGRVVVTTTNSLDTSLILRAVNSHEALLESAKRLEGVLNAIEHDQLKPVASVLAEYREQVRQAIAQAEKGA